jgi:hypothetical protein
MMLQKVQNELMYDGLIQKIFCYEKQAISPNVSTLNGTFKHAKNSQISTILSNDFII